MTGLAGRDAVLAATDHHPYARRNTGDGGAVRALVDGSSAAWITTVGRTPALDALGDPERVVDLVAAFHARGELADVRRIHLPRVDEALLTPQLRIGEPDHWDFRWTTTPPPQQPGEDQVARLDAGAGAAVNQLLDRALPDTFTRPGKPGIVRWYGIWEGDRLVACGADRTRGGVGSLSAIAVDPDFRGRGLGAALTAAMTRDVARDLDVVALGVMADNQRAIRLYRRLGFTRCTPRTSAELLH